MEPITKAGISSQTRVFVRCDLDVPVEDGKVQDTYRLDSDLKTLRFIIDKGGVPVIAGHMDRPGGKVVEEFSTKHLDRYFDSKLGAGKYELLENLRFDSREEGNSEEFAKELVEQTKTSIYVNEAFTNSHREHTSMVQLPKLLPSYVGFQVLEEVEVLGGLLKDPARPFVAIVGGSKIETKKPFVKKFLKICDAVLVGGKIGQDWDEETPENLHLASDYIDGMDIGKETMNDFAEVVSTAKTVVWSGPMGKYEEEEYITGTHLLADEILASGAYCVVGGGDLIAALKEVDLLDLFSFASVGGGAMLQFLEDGALPALEVLQ